MIAKKLVEDHLLFRIKELLFSNSGNKDTRGKLFLSRIIFIGIEEIMKAIFL